MNAKNWLCLPTLLLFLLAAGSSALKAETNTPPSMTFGGQMSALAAELLDFKDPEVKGRKLQLTKIVSKYTVNSDFTLRVEKELSERLTSILDPKAELLLTGEIDYFESESADNNGFKVTRASILEQVSNYRIYLRRQPPSLLVPRAKKPKSIPIGSTGQ